MPHHHDDDTHECPGPGCTRRVPSHMLACARHWRQVPMNLQQRVYRTWNRGAGYGTPEHHEAMQAAVATMRP
jgi:hypothetical protein